MRATLFIILFLTQFAIKAQDTIFRRDGQILSVKVMEVNIKELSYKRADLLDGPLFIINKDEIKQVKYFNGAVDVFTVAKKVEQVVVYSNPRDAFMGNNQILSDLRRGKYIYHGRTISDRKVLFLASQKNHIWNNAEIQSHISASKRYNSLQKSIGISGAILGGIGCYGSLIATTTSSSSNDGAIIGVVGLASAGILVASQVLSFQFKLNRLKHADAVADAYNQLIKE